MATQSSEAPQALMEAETRVEEEDGVTIIAVDGEFDLAREPGFTAALEEALTGAAPLVVDLEHCRFIDSAGIALVVRTSRLPTSRDVPMRSASASRPRARSARADVMRWMAGWPTPISPSAARCSA